MLEIDYATTERARQPARAWMVIAAFGIGDVFVGTFANLCYEYFGSHSSGDDSLEILVFGQILLLAFALVLFSVIAAVRRKSSAIVNAPLIALLFGIAYGVLPVVGFLQEDWGVANDFAAYLLVVMAIGIPLILPIWLFSRRGAASTTA